ncbi:MAG: L,D-transpeptidase family protein [Zoogloeaceae bacterium]|nr:L,D-transpeptidase family protein [Zoogloeaceae bacterium]
MALALALPLTLFVFYFFPVLREIVTPSFSAPHNATPLPAPTAGFIGQQLAHARVKTAWNDKAAIVRRNLRDNALSENDLNILISVYKDERLLEIHAKNARATNFKKVAAYDLCRLSGKLGPKRKQGDQQVPEGFYHINRFNPASSYYLSLGINYPNSADRKKSAATDLGGDIFIHGDCVTVGCLPMTDDKIKEIYLYAVHAKNSGQVKIPVYIFPFKMTAATFARHAEKHRNEPELLAFWRNLQTGFERFTAKNMALNFSIDEDGGYRF